MLLPAKFLVSVCIAVSLGVIVAGAYVLVTARARFDRAANTRDGGIRPVGPLETASEPIVVESAKPDLVYESGPATQTSAVTAVIGGQRYVVIPASEDKCFRIVAQRDFDGDGTGDALVAHVRGCGGNCCGDSYFFLSYSGDGHFARSESFGNSWQDPDIGEWNGRMSVKVVSNNEGINATDAREIAERFVLESGNAVKVESTVRAELAAVKEIRSSQLAANKKQLSLGFDLDGDGTTDELTGKLWERWGRLILTVRLGSNPPVETDINCRRIGVLESKTAGVYDLVCDQDRILRWTGKTYSAVETPPVTAPAPGPVPAPAK